MATSAGEVEVKLTLNADDFKRLMGDATSKMGGFGSALDELEGRLLKVFSYAAIADFFKQSIQAYADSELATAKLVATLEAHGIASEKLVTHLEAQATSLEKLTGIQRDSITNAQALLVSYGLTGPTLDKATVAAANFAARTGSIESATNLLSKAYDGNTTMLKRYGITVDQTLEPQQQFEALLNKINQQFGPLASAQVGTFSGQITSLGNAFTHLEEAVGKLLTGQGGGIVGWLKSLVNSMTQAVNFLQRISDASHSFADIIKGVVIVAMEAVMNHMLSVLSTILSIASHIPVIGAQFAALKGQLDLVREEIKLLDKTEQDHFVHSVANNKAIQQGEGDKLTTFKNVAQSHMDVDTTMEAWIRNQQLLSKNEFLAHLKDEDQGYSAFADAFLTTQKDVWQKAGAISTEFFNGISDAWAKQVVEGKNFTESVKSMFKNMAEELLSYITQVITKLMVMWALEKATNLNVAGAGSGVSVFSGMSGFMASGGMINEPSVITGLRSGRSVLAGEAGPEAVVPMNQTADEMGGGGGGHGAGNITINIQGQFLEADSATWNKLMRDQIIPQIRRFTMISSTGPFNRTRGFV